uniref:VWFA domain-containing protein n=1 Tax=Caenorhabditis tropicalis TaxID=1561998 RepID=A0A1I7TI59_9PELO
MPSFNGRIITVFELNAVQSEIQGVVDFVSNYLFVNSVYNFSSVTQEINIPYANTYNYRTSILSFGDAKSLADIQSNIDTLYNAAVLTTNPTVSDGLDWIINNIAAPNPGSKNVIIVVGYHADDDYGSTLGDLVTLRQQGYKVFSVAVGNNHGDLSAIADRPDWYFQVSDEQLSPRDASNAIANCLCQL